MTRNFELSDEIEKKDDLDNKPDHSSENLDQMVRQYSDYLEAFFQDISDLQSAGDFDLAYDTFQASVISNFSCPHPNSGLSSSSFRKHKVDQKLEPIIRKASLVTDKFAGLGDCLPHKGPAFSTGRIGYNRVKNSKTQISFDGIEFVNRLSIPMDESIQAGIVFAHLDSAFARFWSKPENTDSRLNETLRENTSLNFLGNQVFIITRLPRAALDELLAKEAK
ncbi:MAG: hypothetical protein KF685_05795 [Acidobacteria bacterium]|nr:hypothetical protein [Acidobacteriota bacterium]